MNPAANAARTRRAGPTVVLIATAVALVLGLGSSVLVGAAHLDLRTVWQAIVAYDTASTAHRIVQEVRLPRVVIGAMVGASLAVAGTIMQAMTRNPLASPSTMGLNAGAGFFLVLAFAFAPGLPYTALIGVSFLGAGFGALMVYGVGALSRGGMTPVKLALAGAAVAALLGALTTGLMITFDVAQDVLFYTAGGVQGARWRQVALLAPWFGSGMLAAWALAPHLTILSVGDDVAVGLGQNVQRVKALATATVLALAGAAVAVAGGVGFIGLVIPHVARFLVGLDYRWIVPASALLGALLLVIADLAARSVNPPFETPVGLMTALVGVPFFLYLARRDQRGM